MSAIWPVAMHDRSRMPELKPDLEKETVHAVERMTMHAAEVTLFGRCGRLESPAATRQRPNDYRAAPHTRPAGPSATMFALVSAIRGSGLRSRVRRFESCWGRR